VPKILIADALSEVAISSLRETGLETDVKTGLSEDELVELIGNYEGVIVRSGTKVTARVLDAAKKLKVVGRAGVGVDNVDVEAASRRGVVVMNTPLGNITSAAEHALALLMALARNIPAADWSMKSGQWDKKRFAGVELAEKTLGVVGMGKIGQIVTRTMLAKGMKVLAFDPFLPERRARELGATLVEFDDLLARADFITIHAPLTDRTRDLFDAGAFGKMKKGVRIVNCARGGIVNEADLAKALADGKVAGAALDVFEQEPLPAESPLRGVPNVVLTPHLGASTKEAQEKVADAIAEQFALFFTTGKILNAVNLSVTLTPEIEPFANLARTLGSMLSQLSSKPPVRLLCSARGRIAAEDTHALAVSALQGLLSHWHDRTVNLVNAPMVAEERGIVITEEKSLESPSYANVVRVAVETDDGECSVAGTVFEGREPRITEIDGFVVDIKPEGHMIVLFYPDRPGMVGKFGTILGNADINIAGMDVGRKEKRGRACIALSVDEVVPPSVLDEMRKAIETGEAHLVKL